MWSSLRRGRSSVGICTSSVGICTKTRDLHFPMYLDVSHIKDSLRHAHASTHARAHSTTQKPVTILRLSLERHVHFLEVSVLERKIVYHCCLTNAFSPLQVELNLISNISDAILCVPRADHV